MCRAWSSPPPGAVDPSCGPLTGGSLWNSASAGLRLSRMHEFETGRGSHDDPQHPEPERRAAGGAGGSRPADAVPDRHRPRPRHAARPLEGRAARGRSRGVEQARSGPARGRAGPLPLPDPRVRRQPSRRPPDAQRLQPDRAGRACGGPHAPQRRPGLQRAEIRAGAAGAHGQDRAGPAPLRRDIASCLRPDAEPEISTDKSAR